MDIFVFADYNSVKLVMSVPLKTFETFLHVQSDRLPTQNF